MKHNTIWVIVGLLLVLALIGGCGRAAEVAEEAPPAPAAPVALALPLPAALADVEKTAPEPEKDAPPTAPDLSGEIQETADGVRYLIHPDKLLSGGPPRTASHPLTRRCSSPWPRRMSGSQTTS